jgi:hypothetical protein
LPVLLNGDGNCLVMLPVQDFSFRDASFPARSLSIWKSQLIWFVPPSWISGNFLSLVPFETQLGWLISSFKKLFSQPCSFNCRNVILGLGKRMGSCPLVEWFGDIEQCSWNCPIVGRGLMEIVNSDEQHQAQRKACETPWRDLIRANRDGGCPGTWLSRAPSWMGPCELCTSREPRKAKEASLPYPKQEPRFTIDPLEMCCLSHISLNLGRNSDCSPRIWSRSSIEFVQKRMNVKMVSAYGRYSK